MKEQRRTFLQCLLGLSGLGAANAVAKMDDESIPLALKSAKDGEFVRITDPEHISPMKLPQFGTRDEGLEKLKVYIAGFVHGLPKPEGDWHFDVQGVFGQLHAARVTIDRQIGSQVIESSFHVDVLHWSYEDVDDNVRNAVQEISNVLPVRIGEGTPREKTILCVGGGTLYERDQSGRLSLVR